jgi:hypothetical protein
MMKDSLNMAGPRFNLRAPELANAESGLRHTTVIAELLIAAMPQLDLAEEGHPLARKAATGVKIRAGGL